MHLRIISAKRDKITNIFIRNQHFLHFGGQLKLQKTSRINNWVSSRDCQLIFERYCIWYSINSAFQIAPACVVFSLGFLF